MVEIWEDNPKLVKKYGELLRGSMTLKITPGFKVCAREILKELTLLVAISIEYILLPSKVVSVN